MKHQSDPGARPPIDAPPRPSRPSGRESSRREFLAYSAGAFAAFSAAGLGVARAAHAGGSDELRLGVIGCGGRGTGAVLDAMTADPGVRLVALADLFPDRLERSRAALAGHERFSGRAAVDPARCHTGFEAYRELLAGDADVVVLATPPHFRPMHFGAAVGAGKHVFMEKPVAVDPVGVRAVLRGAEEADAKGLCVVAGTQRRFAPEYREAMRRLKEGVIGEPVSARCSWNQGGLWVHERKPGYSDMEWQIRNWLYFTWLSGDHIVEQHVHNLDVINWALGSHPLRASGMGGREVRTGEQYGNVFDHFAVEYEYPGGVHVLSEARQIDGCDGRVDEIVHGTKGTLYTRPGYASVTPRGATEPTWRHENPDVNPYVEEHRALFGAIRGGETVNGARAVAESTLTAIMGRMSAYTGKAVTWEQAMRSVLDLSPERYEFGPHEADPVAVPGRTPLVIDPPHPPPPVPAAAPAPSERPAAKPEVNAP